MQTEAGDDIEAEDGVVIDMEQAIGGAECDPAVHLPLWFLEGK